jgi:hypothetical protein
MTPRGLIRALLEAHDAYLFRGAGRPEERAPVEARFLALKAETLDRLASVVYPEPAPHCPDCGREVHSPARCLECEFKFQLNTPRS